MAWMTYRWYRTSSSEQSSGRRASSSWTFVLVVTRTSGFMGQPILPGRCRRGCRQRHVHMGLPGHASQGMQTRTATTLEFYCLYTVPLRLCPTELDPGRPQRPQPGRAVGIPGQMTSLLIRFHSDAALDGSWRPSARRDEAQRGEVRQVPGLTGKKRHLRDRGVCSDVEVR